MKVWVYVEGVSDEHALTALWESWSEQLRLAGHGVQIIPLNGKPRFFQRIGHLAARILYDNDEDIVIGLPDLYPNRDFERTKFKHQDMEELKQVQNREVGDALKTIFNVSEVKTRKLLKRFLPSAFKHDAEMLLLAAKEQLRSYLGTTDELGGWCNPVEEQNQNQPPKRVVEGLFRTKSARRRAYHATKDASAILCKVSEVRTIIYNSIGQVQCPVFKAALDWIGCRTGVVAYS